MIYSVPFYEAKCDHCGRKWRDEHNGIQAFVNRFQMSDSLSDSEWLFGDSLDIPGSGGKHYCPDCVDIDDNDEYFLKPDRKKHETGMSLLAIKDQFQ